MSKDARLALFSVVIALVLLACIVGIVYFARQPDEEAIRCAQMGGEWLSGYGGNVHTCIDKSVVLFR
jgi:hypothetical protein